MNKYIIGLSFLFSVFACQNATEDKKEYVQIVNADATAVMKIDGMMCQKGCASYLSDNLSQIEGVASCEVRLSDSTAVVSYDNSLTNEMVFIDYINSVKDSAYLVTMVDVELIKDIKKEKIQMH
ncbi:MAG: heavy-metal-associated domain-containing protein [Flavobacteriales bacterium]